MSTSTDAILFYGYCWEEERSRPWRIGNDDDDDGEDDWEERYAAAKGITAPTRAYPERRGPNGGSPTDYTAEEQSIVDEYSEYWRAQRAIAKASGCEVGSHCSGDYPMPYVAVSASEKRAYRGSMVPITSLDIAPEWPGQLADFCAALGIPTEGLTAGWYLVSYWG